MSRAAGGPSLAVLALLVGALFPAPARGQAIEGFDRAWILPPAGVVVADYASAGYRTKVVDGVVEVDVDAGPLASREPFRLPAGPPQGAVAELARRLAAGADSRYVAVSRVLDWVARSIRYDLDRDLPQDAESVLVRRNGYCTGLARLSVALLAALDLRAREVAGYVVSDPESPLPAGFHRWIEVYYSDRGWVASDPLRSHHFVPAQYLRLASETVDGDHGPALLLARENRLEVVDLYHGGPPGILARRNDPRQLSAALKVEVGETGGDLELAGGGGSWRASLAGGGSTTFVGLPPGEYHLTLLVDGRAAAERRLRFRAPVRAAVELANQP